MGKNRHHHSLYIVWNTVGSTFNKRTGLSRTLKRYSPSRTHSKFKYLRVSGLSYNCQYIIQNRFIYANLLYYSLENYYFFLRYNWLNSIPGFYRAEPYEDFLFTLKTRIPNAYPHREPIELVFRKRKSTPIFKRVLSGNYHKWFWKLVCSSVNSYFRLTHCFKKCALGFRCSSVYFICKNYIRKNWTGLEVKLSGFLVENRDSED